MLIYEGFACNHCQYCTKDMKLMRKHFSNEYHGLKTLENSQKCMIQISFKVKLWKYIQMNEFDNKMMRENDENNDEEWNKTLEKKFKKNIKWINMKMK